MHCEYEEPVNVSALFGSMVFNDSVMRERLPRHIYTSLKKTIEQGSRLEESLAEVVASTMKDWAIEKGATHYTHWFQPMTGITAEKHDSFISPIADGKAIMEFSGKELVRGEPDASSFPSGGLRATFEARGYTAWDPTSYAFVKDYTLYIPTVFCSYGGEILDKKTPLIRSMEAVSFQALRVLRLFGNTTARRVITTVGSEQEYFLVPKDLYRQRKDLIFTGRTLFGAKPPKGQELEDHYFGNIKEQVAGFMRELDIELWKLGISAKTEHNEAAPAQHELAPIYNTSNIACDHNQLTMELMKKIADHHGLACLLHAKPFAGVNGSGKHNNWSLCTDTGENLFEPGSSPGRNAQFLLFLCAVIKGVDEYADLLRISTATADNDHRLGANEAPPSIISIFLGDDLMDILEALADGRSLKSSPGKVLEIGVSSLPKLPMDSTDRNRTSPFAFTGNKFEFRMLSASASVAEPNIMLNTIMAEELCEFANILEKADDFNDTLHDLLAKTYREHKRVIFSGNNYAAEWVREAEKRGLHNYPSTPDALPHFSDARNLELFRKHHVFSETEVVSRQEILTENYNKAINIEALTMLDMAKKQILPCAIAFGKHLTDAYMAKKQCGLDLSLEAEEGLLKKVSYLSASIAQKIQALEAKVIQARGIEDVAAAARCYHDHVFAAMQELRESCDELETIAPENLWPFPTYSQLMFYV
ncbi:glutamine synthetase III [Christensenellaceae bacterium NSJ-63]|uniref:Glutamine synthetase III n=1 Tax=Guopingia tenuis TaxID=2763656 RepID=A0A926DJR5_9FIRM|nr:glutamine synthetase III [Guopingia tenuis]MBC8539017.1 glutamine synthetase III [Guopingia tenuis]